MSIESATAATTKSLGLPCLHPISASALQTLRDAGQTTTECAYCGATVRV